MHHIRFPNPTQGHLQVKDRKVREDMRSIVRSVGREGATKWPYDSIYTNNPATRKSPGPEVAPTS